MRRGGLNLVTGLLVLVLTVGVISADVSSKLQARPVEQALSRADAYAAVAPSILDQYRSFSFAGVSAADPVARTATGQAFSGRYVSQVVNPALDSTFEWLAGKRAAPDFTVNYGAGKKDFIEQVSQAVANQVAERPVCSFQQILDIGYQGLQSASMLAQLPCRPPGLTSAQIQQLLRLYLSHAPRQPALFSKTSYRAKDITVRGQPFYQTDAAKQVRAMYRILGWLPWICAAVALLLLAGIRQLSRDGRKTTVRLAVCLVLAGLISCVVAFSLPPLLQHAASSALARLSTYQTLAKSLHDATALLAVGAARDLKLAGVGLLLTGAALLVVLQMYAKQLRKPAAS